MVASFDRRSFLATTLAASALGVREAASGTREPWQGDMSAYTVRDPLAGYFDIAERRHLLNHSTDTALSNARIKIFTKTPDCRDVLAIPIQNQTLVIPPFYENREAWRVAITPFRLFEDAVSHLAAANLIADNKRFADCLLDLLSAWARADGLAGFNHAPNRQQGWFQVESTLFAIGHALAAVGPDLAHRPDDLAMIHAWLARVARSHFSIPGRPLGTCCNNHYYRRSLYAAIIGVIAQDDKLFQSGLRAVYSALDGATPEGALPLEMKRGELAGHYQNYAVMYLAMIAHIGERQGYRLWELELNGLTLHSLVDFNNKIMADPEFVLPYSGAPEVSLRYRADSQYFAWYEIYLAKFPNAQMSEWVAPRRPLFNRSLGGHMTAYFYKPA